VPVVVRFDGPAISSARIEGPFSIEHVSVASDQDGFRSFSRLAYREHAHTTAFLDCARFARAPHVFGLIEDDGVPLPDASVRMVSIGQPAVPDSAGNYHLGTPDLQPGTFTVSMTLPSGQDSTGWRVLRNGLEFATGRSAVLTFGEHDAMRVDFVRGAAVSVPPAPAHGTLLTIKPLGSNPSRGGSSIRLHYTLSRAATLDVSAFDIHGRRVVGPLLLSRSAGAGEVELSPGPGLPLVLAPGVYQVRISARSGDGSAQSWVGRRVVLD
jgi:hypothetical protein